MGRKYVFYFCAILIAALTACGGTGGGGADDSGTNAPAIANLRFTPNSAIQNQDRGSVTLTGTVDFIDEDGDIVSFTVIGISGSSTIPVQGLTGIQTGAVPIVVSLSTAISGSFQFSVYITDSQGNNSNVLIGDFTVFVDLGIDPFIQLSSITADNGPQFDAALHRCPPDYSGFEPMLLDEFGDLTIIATSITPDPFPVDVDQCTITFKQGLSHPTVPEIESYTIYPDCIITGAGLTVCPNFPIMDVGRKAQFWVDVNGGLNLPIEYPTRYIAIFYCEYMTVYNERGSFTFEYEAWLSDVDNCTSSPYYQSSLLDVEQSQFYHQLYTRLKRFVHTLTDYRI